MTSIIILSYNTLTYTRWCLESIRRFTEPGTYEIIVVDNASTDGSRAFLRQQEDVRLIESEGNLGFPKGCNVGMAAARGDALLLLNSDTIVTPRWLVQLRRALDSRPEVGAVGCVSNYVANYQQIDVPYLGSEGGLDALFSFAEQYNCSDPAKWERRLRLVGFCYLVKRAVYEKIGGLDERFSPGNYEDDDYSLRIWQAGYECLLCRDTFIHHFGNRSFQQLFEAQGAGDGGLSKKFNATLQKNLKKFCAKWHVDEKYHMGKLRDIFPNWKGPEVVSLAEIQQAIKAAGQRQKRSEQLTAAIDAADEAAVRALLPEVAAEAAPTGVELFLMGRGTLLLGDVETAEACLRQAQQTAGLPGWCRGACASALAQIYEKTGRLEEAVEALRVSIAEKTVETGLREEYSNLLFHLHYLTTPPEELLATAKEYGKLLAGIRPYHHAHKRRHARLRVGYVSPDFCRHIVAFFAYALLMHYDRRVFDVYCYQNGLEDDVSRELRAQVTAWRNVQGMEAGAVARQIREDEIDILVDLAGHTGGNLLPVFAYRPAPVQLSAIGYFGTTGVPGMDYVLTDEVVEPPEGSSDAYFTERLYRLPVSQLCYMWHDRPPAPGEAPCRRTGYVTFGCFNAFAKLNDKVLAAWAEILRQVPRSRLFLKQAVFRTAYGQRLAAAKLQAAGIDLVRVDFAAAEPDYLGAYHAVDIALDPFPYPGGGTTCDALYMGVPVVTLRGSRHGARFGAGLLTYAGCPELVASSVADYVARAVALARDPTRIERYHETLRRQVHASPVMQGETYCIEVERAYQVMYARFLYGNDVSRAAADARDALSRAQGAGDWAAAVQAAGALSGLTARREEAAYADAAGMAYLSLADWPRAYYWLARGSRQRAARPAYHAWALGLAALEQDAYVTAAEHFAEAMRLHDTEQGELREAFLTDLYTRHAVTCLMRGKTEEAAADYHRAARHAVTLEDRVGMTSSWLMSLHNRVHAPAELLKFHRSFNDILDGVARPYAHSAARHRHARLRVGYLSPDFRQQVMFYFYYQLLAGADRSRFELYAYSLGQRQDGFTEQVRQAVDHFRVLSGASYEAIAQTVYEDEIDVLVDLAGHAAGSGLAALAWRPAPVQISGLGYMDTTGLRTVDYLLTDDACDPQEAQHALSEQPLYLRSLFCYTGRSDVPAPQGAPCRENGYVTFGVFNRWQKVTDEMLGLWREIADAVPDAHFLLKCEALGDDRLAAEVYERLSVRGFDMAHVTLEPASADYMARYLDVDIALDTYPYVGGGTTCDALYMGVPVVTRYGAARGTRYAYSMLRAAGLAELAAATPEAYVRCAVALAQDSELLDSLHRRLRQMVLAAPLMDTPAYVREVEADYQRVFCAWRDRAGKGEGTGD